MSSDRYENGSVLVESIFATLFLLVLLLGVTQTVLIVYSRNVVQAAAQEGARSSIERGATAAAAVSAARTTVSSSAGRLLDETTVLVRRSPVSGGTLVTVRVAGRLRAVGPLPIRFPVVAVGRAVAIRPPR